MKDLKQRTIRGGFARLCGQAAYFVLRIGFLVILARLLDPEDFGLVAMVTVITGVYEIFSSGGLAAATVQKATITNEQISTLFWINMLIGAALGFLCLATAPALATFYHEPRLFWMTVAMGAGFLFSAAGVQHYALLQRQLRYVVLTAIETLSLLVSIAVGIGMAVGGLGYWALVGAAVASPAVSAIGLWIATAWIPGLPRRNVEILSMLGFGGTITLNTLVVYIAYNLDKVLLGRFWGADALGVYGRAYQLINIPTQNLNSAIGGIAYSALARLQNDPVRFRSYFLKGYSFVNSLTLPTTMFCALFADDIIMVALGPKWTDAVPIFRLLAPTVLIFGLINPLAWLMLSIGLQGRSLRIALVIAPLTITAYFIGLPFGPNGVAFAYSAAMILWLVPHILWCVHGTMVSPRDLFFAISTPLLSAIVAATIAFGPHWYFTNWEAPLLRLAIAGGIMAIAYAWMLLFVMGQRRHYQSILAELRGSSPPQMEDSQTGPVV